MNVRAVFHRSAETSLKEWHSRISQPPGGDPSLALFMRDEILDILEKKEGFPEGAIFRTDLTPQGWVWQFAAGTWLHYGVRDSSGFLGITRRREVVIFQIYQDCPVSKASQLPHR